MKNVEYIKPTGIFTNYIYKAIPLAFDESMSYYETLCGILDYLNTTTDVINNNAELLAELESYVKHYFDNLDVQEEINNKLDQLVDDGTLENLIGAYIQPRINAQNEVINDFKTQVNNNVATQNQNISNLQNSTNASITAMQTQIDALESGSPLVASSTGGMTDTSRIYVNTTDGKWYYYDGDSWKIGGTYQSTGLNDGSVTLNILGTDVLFNLNTRINEKDSLNYNDIVTINMADNLIRKNINGSGKISTDSTTRVLTNNLYYVPPTTLIKIAKNTYNYTVRFYFYDKDFNFINQNFISQVGLSNNLLFAIPFDYKYIRFRFSKATDTDEITTQEVLDNMSITFEKNPVLKKSSFSVGTNLLNSSKYLAGYINGASYPYTRVESGSYKSTLIPVEASQQYFVNNFRKFALYDINMNYIANSFVDTITNSYTVTPSVEGYMAISWNSSNNFVVKGSSGSYSAYTETLPDYVLLNNVSNLGDLIDATNVLYGKKYVALGDSFTHGDFTNSPTDDYTIESGTYSGEYKVYPYLIGNRNLMTVSNLAVNGMTITNINSSSNNYLSNDILATIDNDVNYITIKIGINDDHQNAPIGTINDNISSTFYGSWNRVLTYLISNYKNAKIGIIVSNGISHVDYVNATINIAKKYGIKYINESTDDNEPLLIRTLRTDVDSSIKSLRDTEWEVYPPTNGHPNAKCHEYESSIIENFLRSL